MKKMKNLLELLIKVLSRKPKEVLPKPVPQGVVIIDDGNLYKTIKEILPTEELFDYEAFFRYLENLLLKEKTQLKEIRYFYFRHPDPTKRQNKDDFVSKVIKNTTYRYTINLESVDRYKIETIKRKRIFGVEEEEKILKERVDSQIVDYLHDHVENDPEITRVVLVSGDGDYDLALRALKKAGKIIIVVAGKDAMSHWLIEMADIHIFIENILEKIEILSRKPPNSKKVKIPKSLNPSKHGVT